MKKALVFAVILLITGAICVAVEKSKPNPEKLCRKIDRAVKRGVAIPEDVVTTAKSNPDSIRKLLSKYSKQAPIPKWLRDLSDRHGYNKTIQKHRLLLRWTETNKDKKKNIPDALKKASKELTKAFEKFEITLKKHETSEVVKDMEKKIKKLRRGKFTLPKPKTWWNRMFGN